MVARRPGCIYKLPYFSNKFSKHRVLQIKFPPRTCLKQKGVLLLFPRSRVLCLVSCWHSSSSRGGEGKAAVKTKRQKAGGGNVRIGCLVRPSVHPEGPPSPRLRPLLSLSARNRLRLRTRFRPPRLSHLDLLRYAIITSLPPCRYLTKSHFSSVFSTRTVVGLGHS